MKKIFSSIVIFASFFSEISQASTPCKDPFSEISERFLLQRLINCDGSPKSRSTFRITNSKDVEYRVIGPEDYYILPKCVEDKDDTIVDINLNYDSVDSVPVFFQENIPYSIKYSFTIIESCTKKHLVKLATFPTDIQTKTQNLTAAAFAVYDTSPSENLLFYVDHDENENSEIIFRSNDGDILARAQSVTNTFKEDGNEKFCYENWNFENNGINPVILSYILASRESGDPCSPGLSSDAEFSIIMTGVAVTFLASVIVDKMNPEGGSNHEPDPENPVSLNTLHDPTST